MIGIDGCRAGWCGVAIDGADSAWSVRRELTAVLSDLEAQIEHARSARIAIDMPIGLPSGDARRACDDLARRALGVRRASLFDAPPRAVLMATDYAAANAAARLATGRGLSVQSWNLVPRIRELDALLRADPGWRARAFESHPELCFARLSGGPCTHGKKSAAGRAERRALLTRLRPSAAIELDAARGACPRSCVADDDLADALVLAIVAALPPQQLDVLPAHAEQDEHGLYMSITVPLTDPR